MNALTFIRRGIWHFKLSYLGVWAGAVLGATVLLGALLAGDSVKETLREVARNRVGKIDQIFIAGEGFFRDELAAEVRGEGLRSAPVLLLKGQLSSQKSGRALGQVQILGVDESFWDFAPSDGMALELPDREVAVNDHLAASLGLAPGDSVILRLQEPGMLSRDAPLSGEAEDVISFRAKVREVLDAPQFGGFNLVATQLPTPTVFVPLKRLQQVIDQPAQANLLLLGSHDRSKKFDESLLARIRNRMKLADYGFSLVDIPLAQATELRSARIFLEPQIVDAVIGRYASALPVTSYLVNTFAANGKETPYSLIAAVGARGAPFLPDDFVQDDIVINEWLAKDLGVSPGQPLRVTYFSLGRGNRLSEVTAEFKVRSIIPLEGLAADRLWMPDFPGVAEAEDAQDWAPGLPLDLGRIRQVDEDYWDDYRGTPKAFITEERGRELFGNRWGNSTSLRVPIAEAGKNEFEGELLTVFHPQMAGLLLRDLREEAIAAAKSPVDIATLFLSMSFFLIVASITLTTMLFRFNIEQRNRESGLLSALGIPAKKVLRWRLWEGLLIVIAGGMVGLGIAVAYSIGILRFLETIWNEGTTDSLFKFHFNPFTMLSGLAVFVEISMLVIWLTVRKQGKKNATLRLEAGTEEVRRGASKVRRILIAEFLCLVAGLGCIVASGAMGPQAAFFLSGMFFLIAGLLNYRAGLGWSGGRKLEVISARSLATLNSGRRPTRSLVVVGTLACGVFLVIAVTAFQKHGGEEWAEKSSGAGGFAFWIETTNPINRTADAKKDPDYFELGDQRDLLGEIRPFRMGVGDDASCFNLNKATRPRLLATDVAALAERDAFALKAVGKGLAIERGWELLRDSSEERVLRAFIDQTTMMWVLKKKVGDRIPYTDEWGGDFEIEITGALADSVFQGSLVVDEEAFLKFYPSQEGYQLFLADVPGELAAAREELQKVTADRGSTITRTQERLEGFHGVENTYIAIFHVLGGLGLILGSAGLGIVTARNLAERRGEFQVLATIGITQAVTKEVIFKEVRTFIGWGLGIGLIASLVAILPAVTGTPPMKTLLGLGGLVVAIALNSLLWAWVGYRVGYRRQAAFGI